MLICQRRREPRPYRRAGPGSTPQSLPDTDTARMMSHAATYKEIDIAAFKTFPSTYRDEQLLFPRFFGLILAEIVSIHNIFHISLSVFVFQFMALQHLISNSQIYVDMPLQGIDYCSPTQTHSLIYRFGFHLFCFF